MKRANVVILTSFDHSLKIIIGIHDFFLYNITKYIF